MSHIHRHRFVRHGLSLSGTLLLVAACHQPQQKATSESVVAADGVTAVCATNAEWNYLSDHPNLPSIWRDVAIQANGGKALTWEGNAADFTVDLAAPCDVPSADFDRFWSPSSGDVQGVFFYVEDMGHGIVKWNSSDCGTLVILWKVDTLEEDDPVDEEAENTEEEGWYSYSFTKSQLDDPDTLTEVVEGLDNPFMVSRFVGIGAGLNGCSSDATIPPLDLSDNYLQTLFVAIGDVNGIATINAN